MINIRGIKDNTDPFYRYKMQKVQIAKEKHMHVITNIKQISENMSRDVLELITYIKKVLGVSITYKDDKAYTTKQINVPEIQDIIYRYIEDRVLCKRCANPETYFESNKLKTIMYCKACNHIENM
jgi:translation initiation factor 2 beta subunit (eIF-2beta)/eIF-5